ncbi:hypothetical protein ACS0TY_013573 [Phlomoides rotata]
MKVEDLSCLMTKATSLGLFEAASIGSNNVEVSHLQFVDDTILMGSARMDNAVVIKRILRNLELISGLKVNFDKCCLFGVNVIGKRLCEMAEILGSGVGSMPFSYLDIKSIFSFGSCREWKKHIFFGGYLGRRRRVEGEVS